MGKNPLNVIVSKVDKRLNSVSKRLTQKLGRVEAFGQTDYKPDEVIYHMNNLNQLDIDGFVNEFGQDTVYSFLHAVVDLREKKASEEFRKW